MSLDCSTKRGERYLLSSSISFWILRVCNSGLSSTLSKNFSPRCSIAISFFNASISSGVRMSGVRSYSSHFFLISSSISIYFCFRISITSCFCKLFIHEVPIGSTHTMSCGLPILLGCLVVFLNSPIDTGFCTSICALVF